MFIFLLPFFIWPSTSCSLLDSDELFYPEADHPLMRQTLRIWLLSWVKDVCLCLVKWTFDTADDGYLNIYWTYKNPHLTRNAAPQNQERPGCSGEAEGVRRYPPTLRQGDWRLATGAILYPYSVWPLHVALTLLSMMTILQSFSFFYKGNAWLSQLLLRLCIWRC